MPKFANCFLSCFGCAFLVSVSSIGHATINVNFTGPNVTHVSYAFPQDALDFENIRRVELVRYSDTATSGPSPALAASTTSGAADLHGTIRDTAVTWGDSYYYSWLIESKDTGDKWKYLPEDSFTLSAVEGTLVFNETLGAGDFPSTATSKPIGSLGVNVPSALTLTIGAGAVVNGGEFEGEGNILVQTGALFTAATVFSLSGSGSFGSGVIFDADTSIGVGAEGNVVVLSGVRFAGPTTIHLFGPGSFASGVSFGASSTIDVHDQVTLDPGADLANVDVTFYSQQNLSSPPVAKSYKFLADSSSIDGGDGLVVLPEADMTISRCDNLAIRGFIDGVSLQLDECSVTGLPQFHQMNGCLFDLTDCVIDRAPGEGWFILTDGSLDALDTVFRDDVELSLPDADLDLDNCRFEKELSCGRDMTVTDCYIHKPDAQLDDLSLTFRDCEIGGFNLMATPTELILEDCIVHGTCQFRADSPTGAPSIRRCHFQGNLELHARTAAEIRDNVFIGRVVVDAYSSDWLSGASPSPTIADNSFVGSNAIEWRGPYLSYPNTDIPVGANYYGDRGGPTLKHSLNYGSEPTFMGEHGSRVFEKSYSGQTILDMAPDPLPAGRFTDTRDVPPSIWLHYWIVGQESLTHRIHGPDPRIAMLQQKETLLSLDVLCSVERLPGVKFQCEFNGALLDPVVEPVLTRDSATLTPGYHRQGMSTVNFILPPVESASVPVRVTMETTPVVMLSGAPLLDPDKGKFAILDTTLNYHPGRSRTAQFQMRIQPVKLRVPFAPSGTPSAGAMAGNMRKVFPAMTPIRQEEMAIESMPAYTFYGLFSAMSTTALLNGVAAELSAKTLMTGAIRGAPDPNSPAVTVAVFAHKAMDSWGDVNKGANLPWRRNLLFVDETDPGTVLHELGHSLGLYTGWEQYDLYPPCGLPLQEMTAFSNIADYEAFFGGSKRISHMPGPGHAAWRDLPTQSDVMGNGNMLMWPLPETMETFSELFEPLYSITPSPESEGDEEPIAITLPSQPDAIKYTGKVESASRRVLIRARTRIILDPVWGYRLRIRPETIRAFDMTTISAATLDYGIFRRSYDVFYNLRAVYPGGWENQGFDCMMTQHDIAYEDDQLFATFDIPNNTTRVEVYRNDTGSPIFAVDLAPTPPTTITSPTGGQNVTAGLDVQWSAPPSPLLEKTTIAANGRPMFENGTYTQPTQHLALVRSTSGDDWELMGMFVEENAIASSSYSLPQGADASVRLLSSTGVGSISDTQVDGLTVTNRAPVVKITRPLFHDVALPGHEWDLWAVVDDAEDGAIEAGVWNSSIDGDLGTSVVLSGVVLSEGYHFLSYTATDSNSAQGSDMVPVTVGPIASVDLAFDDNSLSLQAAGADPMNTPLLPIDPGTTHTAVLTVRALGTPCTATLKLAINGPTGKATLVDEVIVFSPLETKRIPASFLPTTDGRYTFTGQLLDVEPWDHDQTNNQWTWTYSTGTGRNPVVDYLLGLTGELSGMDANSDGVVDVSDAFWLN